MSIITRKIKLNPVATELSSTNEIYKYIKNLSSEMATMGNKIIRLSESYEQELVASSILKENKKMRFIGKTNKGNLVFEYMDQQVKVSPKGRIL